MSSPEDRPAGYVSRDPWPVQELGSHTLTHTVSRGNYYLTDEEAELMAYAGYPDVQADLLNARTGNLEQAEETTAKSAHGAPQPETIAQLVARTRYVVSSTPVIGSSPRNVETLTTEVL